VDYSNTAISLPSAVEKTLILCWYYLQCSEINTFTDEAVTRGHVVLYVFNKSGNRGNQPYASNPRVDVIQKTT
jgi:hypothetical protein